MSEAISKNENNIDSSILAMVNNESDKNKSDFDIDGAEFTNIINTMTSNIEKVQSDFVDKAAIKSNTSSINQFVLQDTSNKDKELDFLQKSSQKLQDSFNIPTIELITSAQFENNDIDNIVKDNTDITLDSSAQTSAPIMPSPSFYSDGNAEYSLFGDVYADLSDNQELDYENIFKTTNKTIDAYFEKNENVDSTSNTVQQKTDYIEAVSIAQEFENISGKTKGTDIFNFDFETEKSVSDAFRNTPGKTQSIDISKTSNAVDLEGFEILEKNEVYEGKIEIKNDLKVNAIDLNNESFDDSGFNNSNQNNQNQSKNNENSAFRNIKNLEKAKETSNIQVQETDEVKNIEDMKFDFVKKMKENLEAEIKVSSFSSSIDDSYTLSAADDIAKMSLNINDSPLKINSSTNNVFHYGDEIVTNTLNLNPKTEVFKNVFESNEILNQIGSKLEHLKDTQGHTQGQKLTLVLRPNDLGRVSIQLTSDSNGLTTHILAQNDEVRAYLEKNIHILKQQFADSGINVNSIQIKTQGQDGFSSYDGNHQLKDDNYNQENKENEQDNKNQNNENEKQQLLFSMQDYDSGFEKDFSQVLNKTTNYDF